MGRSRLSRRGYQIDRLEQRLLLSRIVIERFGGVLGASHDGFFIPFGPGDQTINDGPSDDQIFVEESDDRQITINLSTGFDLVGVGGGDLDNLGSAPVIVNAGTDINQDDVTIEDAQDVGSDTYNFSESSGLIRIVKPDSAGNESEEVRVGQSRVRLKIRCNRGDDTLNVDSTVSINNTDQELIIEQPTDLSTNESYSTVVNFNGVISSLGRFEFDGSTGTSEFNTLNLNGDTFSSSGRVDFPGELNDVLNVNDTAATDRYELYSGSIRLIDGTSAGTIHYNQLGVLVTVNSQNATAASEFQFMLGTIPDDRFVCDYTLNCGGGDDLVIVGQGLLGPLNSDLVIDGQGGADTIAFDATAAAGAGGQLQNNLFSIGTHPVTMTSFQTFEFDGSDRGDAVNIGTGNTEFSSILLLGNDGNDTFTITPNAAADITIGGGANASGNDVLSLTANGARRGELNVTGTGTGDYTFGNRHPIHYTGLEVESQPGIAPGKPDLLAADDTGRSTNDDVTNRATPTFTGTSTANLEVVLYRDGTETSFATATSAGTWSIAASAFPVADDTYSMTARTQSTTSGLLSLPGTALSVRVDRLAPATPAAPDLTSDSGISNTDNITNDSTPAFAGTVEANALVRLLAGSTQVGSVTLGTGVSAYGVTASTLTDGVKSMTVSQEDLAGNISASSPALSVTIDTVAPADPTAAPDLDTASDSGASPTDNITNDNTPGLSGAVLANLIVRLFNGTTLVGTDSATSTGAFAIVSTTLADGSRPMSTRFEDLAGNQSVPSPLLNVTVDTVGPTFASGLMVFSPTHQLRYTYSEALDPATVTTNDLVLQNFATNSLIPGTSMAVTTTGAAATFTFPGFAGGILPDGSFSGTLPISQMSDIAGNASAQSANHQFIWSAGTAGDDVYTISTTADGTHVEVRKNNAVVPFSGTRSTLDAIGIGAGAGSDRFSVDLANGSPVPPDGMNLDGGADADQLSVLGTAAAESVTFANASAIIGGVKSDEGAIESVQFDGKGGFDTVSISGGPSVTFTATQHLQSLSITGTAAASLLAGGNRVLVTRALSMSGTAKLDLNDNDLLLDYTGTSALPAVQSLINAARAGGAWTGNGLTSTAARNATAHNTTLGAMEASDFKSIYGAAATFNGEALDTTSVLVKYTYYGDTDFNGKVNFDDYVRTDNGFNNHRSGWTDGDSDGNGEVNFDDYVLIDLAFNTQGAALGRFNSVGSAKRVSGLI